MPITAPIQQPIIARNPAFDMFRNAAVPQISMSAMENFSNWVELKAKNSEEPIDKQAVKMEFYQKLIADKANELAQNQMQGIMLDRNPMPPHTGNATPPMGKQTVWENPLAEQDNPILDNTPLPRENRTILDNTPLPKDMKQHTGNPPLPTIDTTIQKSESTEGKVYYRGNMAKGQEGNYYTTDKEFARNFTQSGQDKEISQVNIAEDKIYRPETLPSANSEKEMDLAIAEAKNKGFSAVEVSEGKGQPNSVFVIDKKILSTPTNRKGK